MIEDFSSSRALQGQTSRLGESSPLIPRFIRLRDAPSYLGMDKNRFNRDVRPLLAVIPIGTQGIAFDFGRRLRAAGVSFEDRQDLLGHRSGRITTHYLPGGTDQPDRGR
jgi:hypothetical protein